MPRLIILTFAFLGWAFWEMSGGADFKPANAGTPEPEPVVVAKLPPVSPKSRPDPSTPQPVTVETAAEATAITSASVTRGAASPAQASVAAPVVLASLPAEKPSGTGAKRLKAPAASPQAAAPATEVTPPPADLRIVNGNRVNLRNGPGTQYSVVAQLLLGDQVMVLQDPGEGWVKLRIGGTVGWMADFLLDARAG